MNTIVKVLAVLFAGAGIALLYAIILSYPIMWCWNAEMPKLFNLPKLGIKDALLLAILFRLLIPTSSSSSKQS